MVSPNNVKQIPGGESSSKENLANVTVQVYDLSLHAALQTQGCGPRQLEVKGEWAWILDEFAATYGIRSTYTTLAHLLWAIRYDGSSSC